VIPDSVSPDGRTLVYSSNSNPSGGAFDLNAWPLTGNGQPKPLMATPKLETNGEISPSGRWIAFESDESGRREIYVRPFPAVDTGRWQISTNGGTRPVWSRNNRELFFVSLDQQMVAVTVELGKDFTYGRPAALFKRNPYYFGVGATVLNGRTYDVAPDGRFLLIKESGQWSGDDGPDARPRRALARRGEEAARTVARPFQRRVDYRLEYFVNAPPACWIEFGPSAANTFPSASTATPSPIVP